MRVEEGPASFAADDMDEDRAANLFLASQFAPVLCRNCERYHLRYIARRALETRDRLDKSTSIRLLAPLIAERVKRDGERIEVVIAGAADNASLATAAAAAASVGALQRCRFTTLDLCATPLMLCETYGRSKGVDVAISTEDLLTSAITYPADFIIVHSLFRHIPAETHLALLLRFGSWLRPGGRIIFSSLLEVPDGPKPSYAGVLEELRAKLVSGALRVAEPIDMFMSRLGTEGRTGGGRAMIADLDAVRMLAAEAGLAVYAEDLAIAEWATSAGMAKRRRGFAVLGKRDSA